MRREDSSAGSTATGYASTSNRGCHPRRTDRGGRHHRTNPRYPPDSLAPVRRKSPQSGEAEQRCDGRRGVRAAAADGRPRQRLADRRGSRHHRCEAAWTRQHGAYSRGGSRRAGSTHPGGPAGSGSVLAQHRGPATACLPRGGYGPLIGDHDRGREIHDVDGRPDANASGDPHPGPGRAGPVQMACGAEYPQKGFGTRRLPSAKGASRCNGL